MAEGARLESVYTGNRIVGSNPTPSANASFAFVRRRSGKPFKYGISGAMPLETASRLLGRVESVLDWATARGYRHGDNPGR